MDNNMRQSKTVKYVLACVIELPPGGKFTLCIGWCDQEPVLVSINGQKAAEISAQFSLPIIDNSNKKTNG